MLFCPQLNQSSWFINLWGHKTIRGEAKKKKESHTLNHICWICSWINSLALVSVCVGLWLHRDEDSTQQFPRPWAHEDLTQILLSVWEHAVSVQIPICSVAAQTQQYKCANYLCYLRADSMRASKKHNMNSDSYCCSKQTYCELRHCEVVVSTPVETLFYLQCHKKPSSTNNLNKLEQRHFWLVEVAVLPWKVLNPHIRLLVEQETSETIKALLTFNTSKMISLGVAMKLLSIH